MAPLTGPQLKLATAHAKIDELKTVLNEFTNDIKSDGFTADTDPDTRELVLKFRVSKSTASDPNWSIAISEIAHLLRSCLDNLAWQLALLNTSTPFPNTEYPIFLYRRSKTGSSYIPNAIGKKTSGRTIGKLQSIRPKHRAMMERTQPYYGRKRRTQHPLWILHEMNNADKHRDIHFTNVANLGNVLQVVGGAPCIIARGLTIRAGMPFEDGAEFMRLGAMAAGSPVKMNPNYSVDVCFDGRCPASFANLPVIKTVRAIEKQVRDIVELFTLEFTV